jgi:molybdopterin/thiamine biosynthesis adenylyltransferase
MTDNDPATYSQSFQIADRVEVVFTEAQFNWLQQHLFQPDANEQAAYAFAAPVKSEGRLKLLVHHFRSMEARDFAEQSQGYIELTPEAAHVLTHAALKENWSLIEIHSHPFADETVHFSQIDINGVIPRFRWMAERMKAPFYHVMLVFGKSSTDGLIYHQPTDSMVPVHAVNVLAQPYRTMLVRQQDNYLAETPVQDEASPYNERVARQVQAFGAEGQRRVAETTVGIVGVGGVGSFIASELAMLGVRRFILIDQDLVELTNLNRFVGARHDDVGQAKVTVVERAIREVDPNAEITTFKSKFPTPETVEALKTVDMLFGCVDNDGARLVLNGFALQYFVPLMDIGTGINTDGEGNIIESGGQYRVVLAGKFCLECVRAIDPVRAQQDLFSDGQRKVHQERGYIPDEEISAPAVVFLNGVLANMAVGEFLNFQTGFREPGRIVYYFMHDQQIRKVNAPRRLDCVACNEESKWGMGDLERVTGLPPDESTAAIDATIEDIPSPG